jgi:tetratricopeptide (TPR) repeat protein
MKMELDNSIKEEIERLDNLSNEIFSLENPQPSIDLLIEAYHLIPQPRTSYFESFNLLYYITAAYFQVGLLDESEKWLPEFLESDSKKMGYGKSEYIAGKIAVKRNDTEKAMQYFTIANAKSGGRAFSKSGDEKVYFDFFKKNLSSKAELRPTSLTKLVSTAKKEIKNNNYSYALSLLYDALNLNQMKPDVHFNKGLCHFELGELDHAADSFTRAYMLDGNTIFNKHDAKYFEFLKTKIKI